MADYLVNDNLYYRSTNSVQSLLFLRQDANAVLSNTRNSVSLAEFNVNGDGFAEYGAGWSTIAGHYDKWLEVCTIEDANGNSPSISYGGIVIFKTTHSQYSGDFPLAYLDYNTSSDYSVWKCYIDVNGTKIQCNWSNFRMTNYFLKVYDSNNNKRYVRIYEEIDRTDISNVTVADASTGITKTTFDPLEPISTSNRTRQADFAITSKTYNSVSVISSGVTHSYVTKTFSSSYSSTGTKSVTATYSYTDANGSSTSKSKTWSITINDWKSVSFSIEAVSGKTFTVYTCQQVGSDFRSAYCIKKTYTSNYQNETYVQTVVSQLELSKMSVTIPNDTPSTFTFDYDISNLSNIQNDKITFTLSTNIVHLASGTAKYDNFTRQSTFLIGNTVSTALLGTLSSSYLTYNDGTTVSLQDLGVNVSMTSNAGTVPFEITDTTPATFSITYTFTGQYISSVGSISFSEDCVVSNDVPNHIVLEGFQHVFNQNEQISYSNTNSAVIKVYNSNGGLIETILQSETNNFAGIITEKHELYTKPVNGNLQDGAVTLWFVARGIRCEQVVCFVYDELTLSVNSSAAQVNFFFDATQNPFVFDFDYTGLVVNRTRHTNSYADGEVTTSVVAVDVAEDEDTSFTHSAIDQTKTTTQTYTVSISYENEFGITLNGSYDVAATPILPESIEATGSGSTINYYRSGVTRFKKPTDLTFTVKFNNNTEQEVSISDLTFYRTSVKIVQGVALTDGVNGDLIELNDGNQIYFKYTTINSVYTGLSSSYSINWLKDRVQSVVFKNNVTFYKGNKLNKATSDGGIQDQPILITFESGGTPTEINSGYAYVNQNIITADPVEKLSIKIDGVDYPEGQDSVVIDNSKTGVTGCKLTYANPYGVVEANLNNFPTEYNNGTDSINPENIVAKTKYYRTRTGTGTDADPYVYSGVCDYEQTLTYITTTISDATEFNASIGETGDAFDGKDYVFGTTIDIDMDGQATQETKLTLSARNFFDSSSISKKIPITVYEILNITGIKLIKAKTLYYLGETFLNEDDDTTIKIFYNDQQTPPQPHFYECRLNQAITAINVYPLKGTQFNVASNDRVITISSAKDTSITVQYSIEIRPKYQYREYRNHNLVAVWFDHYDYYDGEINAWTGFDNKWMLVERNMIKGVEEEQYIDVGNKESTRIDNNGRRVPDDTKGYGYNDLIVRGYLENVGDLSKNGKVVLFNDYIPPNRSASNITVKFPYYQEGAADYINKCHFGILFGNNNAKNRLFLSGNEDNKNCDWYSGVVNEYTADSEDVLNGNFGYFEDTSWCYYGETDNKIIGYDIVSNDKLLVLKDHSDKETTVYFRTPVLVTALDSSGSEMYGVRGEQLAQDEFALVKGNNSVAGISPKSIANFNGDSVFLSNEKELVGLDLQGIIGDNQRYANSRSRYIDEDLRNQDLTDAFLWTNNTYLFIVLKNKIYVTHYRLKGETQYEWFVIDVPNVSSILEKDGRIYFGDNKGGLFKFVDNYKDARKIFAGYGDTVLGADEDAELIIDATCLSNLDSEKKYFFKPVPFDEADADSSYLYYSLGSVRNVSDDCDFYVSNGNTDNVLELVATKNGVTDGNRLLTILQRISEQVPVFVNRINRSVNDIEIINDSPLDKLWGETLPNGQKTPYGQKFYLKEYGVSSTKHLYQLIDADGNVVPIKDLISARLCLRITEEKEMCNIDATRGTFKLKSDGEVLDIVYYDNQSLNNPFRGEIIEYSNVEAFYITKPYTMGSLEYRKTVWSWTLTNDSNIPSELNLCYANNKIPYENMKTLARVSKDALGFDFSTFNFSKVDFEKNVVPRTYTSKRILSGVKFLCFAFRNYNDTNSVLSSMTLTYTIPYPSYSGD